MTKHTSRTSMPIPLDKVIFSKNDSAMKVPCKYFILKRYLLLGNVAENKKFLCFTTINLWSCLATRERSASAYPCRSCAEAFKRTGLRESYSSWSKSPEILAPNGRHLRVQHTYGWEDVSSFLIQQGGRRGWWRSTLQKNTLPWWYVFVTVGRIFCHACTSMPNLWQNQDSHTCAVIEVFHDITKIIITEVSTSMTINRASQKCFRQG